jgi:hypothetical protein
MDKTYNLVSRRREWLVRAGRFAAASLLTSRGIAQPKLFPLRTTGLDHLSITVPDSAAAATYYARIFDPQVFHERTGVQRYYVRLGAAYLAFGPQANATPHIDHIAVGVIDFVEEDFGKPETKAQITEAGLIAPQGVLPMIADPDKLRLQLVNSKHGLFDTLMPGGRVTTEPAAFTPIGLDHIVAAVSDLEKSAAHYRKIFVPAVRDKNRVWFQLADTRLGLEQVAQGEKPRFSRFCVKIAGFNRTAAVERLRRLGIDTAPGNEKGSLRFRDLHNLAVEIVGG